MLPYVILVLVMIFVDQVTKLWAVNALASTSLPLLPFLDFELAFNTGAAFNFLSDAGGWQQPFFIIVAGIVVVVLWFMMRGAIRPQGQVSQAPVQRELALGCALVMAGAVGNLIDRIRLQKVVDFIHVFYGNWHFPTFNVADSAITIGVILLIVDSIGLRLFSAKAGPDSKPTDS